MKHSIAAPKGHWLKTPFAYLIRYVPSGVYFSRIRVQGKLIRRPLKTTSLTVAKLGLGDLEKFERQRVGAQGAVENGSLGFGDTLAMFRSRLHRDAATKSRTKELREERISALLRSWPGLKEIAVRKISKQDCLSRASKYSTIARPPCVNTCVATLRMVISANG